ncbi:MAG: helicase-related protein, partial [Bacillota bacterium]|nr:helicase-related protein [Bacillota bacterium]
FRDGKIDVLVATTVIEVGVNVPNATIMVIMESDRFGLSQLHQLRGRVGRGDKQSYCFLMSNQQFAERLEILVQSRDGLEIAEVDLAQRGAGAFFGSEQHGRLPVRFPFQVDDIETANRWALELVAKAEAGDESAIEYIARRKEDWHADHRRNEARCKA